MTDKEDNNAIADTAPLLPKGSRIELISDSKGRPLVRVSDKGDKDLWIFHRYVDMLDVEKQLSKGMYGFLRDQNKKTASGEEKDQEITSIDDFLDFKDKPILCG